MISRRARAIAHVRTLRRRRRSPRRLPPPPRPQVVQKAADIQEAISEGSNSFLYTEYKYMGVFGVSEGAGAGLAVAGLSAN